MIKLSQASAFIIFYAIFLGAMLSSMGRHSAFATSSIIRPKKSDNYPLLRLLLGLAFLNVLPVVNFFVWFRYMNQNSSVCSTQIGAAIVACFTIFACNRLYSTVSGLTGSLHKDDDDWKNPPLDHFVGALIYIFVPLILFIILNRNGR